MIMWRLPDAAWEDPFRPPETPCPVRCLHCDAEYSSDEIVWRQGPDGSGFWCCPRPGCDGKGFHFDIHPLDSALWAEEDGGEDFDDDVPW